MIFLRTFPQAYFHAYKLKRCRVIGWSWSMLVWANLTKQKKIRNQGAELKFSTVTEIISPERRELKIVKIQDQLSVLKFFSFNNPLARQSSKSYIFFQKSFQLSIHSKLKFWGLVVECGPFKITAVCLFSSFYPLSVAKSEEMSFKFEWISQTALNPHPLFIFSLPVFTLHDKNFPSKKLWFSSMTADPKQVIFWFVYHFRCSSTKIFQFAKFQLFVLIQKLGEVLFKNQFCNKNLLMSKKKRVFSNWQRIKLAWKFWQIKVFTFFQLLK